MTFTDSIYLWFIILWSVTIIGFLISAASFFREFRDTVVQHIGPLPNPGVSLNLVPLVILVTRIGEFNANESSGWWILRLLGVGLSLYSLVMLPWTMRLLKHQGIPGVAVLREHKLITSGPYRLVRHPGYSATLALWFGTALGTLNWLLLVLWPVFLVILIVVAMRQEEALLKERFGQAYRDYSEKTPRIIPGIW
jgi:protein-S-isoprenylcysteine O-methyltransferase Ste14